MKMVRAANKQKKLLVDVRFHTFFKTEAYNNGMTIAAYSRKLVDDSKKLSEYNNNLVSNKKFRRWNFGFK
jgi:hypothetical protein